MSFSPLSAVKHRITLGAPIPFNIRNADGTLLLARGKVLNSTDQIDALEDRGALVDSEDPSSIAAQVRNAPVERLPALWSACMTRVGRTLHDSVLPNFTDSLELVSKPVLALIERDPDLAIFQMVRPDRADQAGYGVTHSLHTAMACCLVAHRLDWPDVDAQRAFKAALTMNLAMLDLQGKLANQLTPVTAAQREAIREHPTRSVEIMQASGIDDETWLTTVLQHHELPDGKGYPQGQAEVSDLARLLRYIDIHTAKLSRRVSREALSADDAARRLFVAHQADPIVSAIVKEFGIYPPGCYVTLASGESGIVIKRGPHANTPVVAALTGRRGDPLVEPLRRDTALRDHAITGVLPEKAIRVRISPERLVKLASA